MKTGTPHVFDFHLGMEILGQEALIGRFEVPLTRSSILERERLFFMDRSFVGNGTRRRDGMTRAAARKSSIRVNVQQITYCF